MGNCASAKGGSDMAEARVRRVLEARMKKDGRRSKTAVPLRAFAAHVRQLHSAEGSEELARQLERLNAISANWERVVFTTECGQAVQNSLKNRYTNVLPYDNNRVVLATVGKANACEEALFESAPTDYVNASYVRCCGNAKEFVASQGPLPATLADHWRMLWQLGCRLVVMVTSCEEAGRQMCERYWPSACGQTANYGQLRVTMETEETRGSWTERRLRLRLGARQRQLQQLQFTQLPDSPEAADPAAFCQFLQIVASRASATVPTVVHCDSGIGRTGVFLCLHRMAAALDCIRNSGEVDVPAAVAALRISRNGIVHTTSQLLFIYRCLLHLLLRSGCLDIGDSEAEGDS